MAEKYGFDRTQKEQMAELLADKNEDLWVPLLNGVTSNIMGDGDIVKAARFQLGNVGGELYWSWYRFNNWVLWCACFVGWCANQCVYIKSGVIPKFSFCTDGANWFKSHDKWKACYYSPAQGEMIFMIEMAMAVPTM